MQDLIALWMPIIASAVAVFIVSAIFWMALPHHKPDVQTMDNGEGFRKAIKDLGVAPGNYMFPNCDHKDMKSPEFQAVWKEGPWGHLRLLPAAPNMGKSLLGTFITFLLISVFVGYLASMMFSGAAADPSAKMVFRFCGAAAVLGHVFGGLPHAFFFGKPARFMITDAVDAIVYGIVTGAVFALLWPAASAAAGTPAVPG